MDISVLIPTYKPGAYFWECLDSLYSQTLPKNKFEVILTLNGCGEPYLTMLHNCIDRYKGMHISILHTDTPGVSNARNMAIDHARGRMICFLDDDDKISESYLQALYEKAESNMLVCSNVKAFDEATGKLSDDYISVAFSALKFYSRPLSCFEGRKFMSTACCKMIPKSVIGNIRFDTRFQLGEDSLFMLAIAPNNRGIKLTPPNAVYYRRLRSLSASRKRRGIKEELANDIRLCYAYTVIWIKNACHLNFFFYLSRIAATLIKFIRFIFL